MRLTFELVNGVEQMALPEEGAHRSPRPGSRHKIDVEYIFRGASLLCLWKL